MTKRGAEEMEASTSVYLTRVSYGMSELVFLSTRASE